MLAYIRRTIARWVNQEVAMLERANDALRRQNDALTAARRTDKASFDSLLGACHLQRDEIETLKARANILDLDCQCLRRDNERLRSRPNVDGVKTWIGERDQEHLLMLRDAASGERGA